MANSISRNTRQAFSQVPWTIFPALAVTLGVTTLASVLLGIIPFFYEIIHTQTVRWLAVLLRGV